MLGSPFADIAAILLLSALLGVVGTLLRQPLIVAFIAAGILIGPSGVGLLESHEQIALLAEIGIALLLFVVGLKLDLNTIRTTGPVALATGLGQVLFTSVFGLLIALGLGFPLIEATYLAVALTFSSTIIIVKLLSDKKEVDSLHGRIAIGFLIVQDLVVVLVMIGLSALGREGEALGHSLLLVAFKGTLFLLVLGLAMRFVLPRLLGQLVRSRELLALFGLAWAVSLAATGDALGFSKEVGAFLAGVSLASTGQREAIAARLASLRDFLLLFFFLDLGARLDLGMLGGKLGPAAVFSLFVLVGNPLIVLAIMGVMGYRRRTGFLAGLTVAQISEFSLILGALGMALGHVSPETMGLLTLVGLVTIGLSTYMILYSGALFQRLAPFLTVFERKDPYRERQAGRVAELQRKVDVVIFGLGRYGQTLALQLQQRKKAVFGVDFDPQVIAQWRRQGLPAVYGDAADPDLLDELPLQGVPLLVSAMPGLAPNLDLLRVLQRHGFSGRIILTANSEEDAAVFLGAGAHGVLKPYSDAADQAADSLIAAIDTPTELPWPMLLRTLALRPGSRAAGRELGALALRDETGTSVLAVTRAGRTLHDLGPDFRLFPGDRLVLVGEPADLERAAVYLDTEEPGADLQTPGVAVDSVTVRDGSPWIARSLTELAFRRRYRATVLGIMRGDRRILGDTGDEALQAGDVLFVAGSRETLDQLAQQQSPEPSDGTQGKAAV